MSLCEAPAVGMQVGGPSRAAPRDDPLLVGAAGATSVDPDPRCPFCVALAALPWPAEGAGTMRLCAPHLRDWRRLQCRGWNADPAHQIKAGQARARQFTPASQQQAGFASWSAFSARWRAFGGLCPLSAAAVRKYVTADMIRHPFRLVSPELQQDIYRAWCAGVFAHVADWLAGEAPPDPHGLWAEAGRAGEVAVGSLDGSDGVRAGVSVGEERGSHGERV